MRIIDSVAAKWEEVAIALGFDASAIACVRRDHSSDCKAACTLVLQKWLNKEYAHICKPVTWSTLIECLKDAEFSSLAHRITEILEL